MREKPYSHFNHLAIFFFEAAKIGEKGSIICSGFYGAAFLIIPAKQRPYLTCHLLSMIFRQSSVIFGKNNLKMDKIKKTSLSLLILAFSCLMGQSTYAASDVSKTTIETVPVISKKESQIKKVRKWGFWSNVKSVFSKKKFKRPNYKTTGSKTFGIISIVFILPSLFGLLATRIGLFLIPIPAIFIFSVLGLILDDEKWPSVISLVYIGIAFLIILAAIISCKNDDACFGD